VSVWKSEIGAFSMNEISMGFKEKRKRNKQRKSKNTKRAGKNEQLWLHSSKRIQTASTKSLKRLKKMLIYSKLKIINKLK
jgi:hypothetical protein